MAQDVLTPHRIKTRESYRQTSATARRRQTGQSSGFVPWREIWRTRRISLPDVPGACLSSKRTEGTVVLRRDPLSGRFTQWLKNKSGCCIASTKCNNCWTGINRIPSGQHIFQDCMLFIGFQVQCAVDLTHHIGSECRIGIVYHLGFYVSLCWYQFFVLISVCFGCSGSFLIISSISAYSGLLVVSVVLVLTRFGVLNVRATLGSVDRCRGQPWEVQDMALPGAKSPGGTWVRAVDPYGFPTSADACAGEMVGPAIFTHVSCVLGADVWLQSTSNDAAMTARSGFGLN